MNETALVASTVVNALVTGLIVFKILKMFLENKANSVEQSLGSLSSTEGTKLQRIIFIILESGMALFAVQIVHVVLTPLQQRMGTSSLVFAVNFVIVIHEMLNVIIISDHSTSFVLLIVTFTWLGHCTNNNVGTRRNEIFLRRRTILR